jgi:hypothetical protein
LAIDIFSPPSELAAKKQADSEKLPKLPISIVTLRRGKMKEVLSMFAGLYAVSLCGFLLFIKKGFLQITGESVLPSIDMSCTYESDESDEIDEIDESEQIA